MISGQLFSSVGIVLCSNCNFESLQAFVVLCMAFVGRGPEKILLFTIIMCCAIRLMLFHSLILTSTAKTVNSSPIVKFQA